MSARGGIVAEVAKAGSCNAAGVVAAGGLRFPCVRNEAVRDGYLRCEVSSAIITERRCTWRAPRRTGDSLNWFSKVRKAVLACLTKTSRPSACWNSSSSSLGCLSSASFVVCCATVGFASWKPSSTSWKEIRSIACWSSGVIRSNRWAHCLM